MRGIPGSLLVKLKRTLLNCGPIDSNHKLASVFVDERLKYWRNSIPDARTREDRVNYFVDAFHDRYNRVNQNILVLFLEVYYEQQRVLNPENECVDRLYDIAVEMAAAVNSGFPPSARYNLVRTSLASEGALPTDNIAGYTPLEPQQDYKPFFDRLPDYLSVTRFAEQLESLKNKQKADWLPISFLEKGLIAARAVGRVEYRGEKIGTAFLVASDLVLTSGHVTKAIPELANGGVRFNVGLAEQEKWHYFAELVIESPVEELDFALVRLTKPAAGIPVTFSDEHLYNSQFANILQHPQGDLMQVALRYNRIVHTDATRFYYVADTEHGSSGSPVFNDGWQLIGMHRAGMRDSADRLVKIANQGVPFQVVKPYIQPFL